MKKTKIILFLIISFIIVGTSNNSVYAAPTTNNQMTDGGSGLYTTQCVYTGTDNNIKFTVTYSVSSNGKGGATINSVKNSYAKIETFNSYVYGKEFITNNEKITCPKYLGYEISGSTMKTSFRSNYSKAMELTDSTNDNRAFSKSNISIVNTCSYDNSVSGRLYVEAYTDGTVQVQSSTNYYDGKGNSINYEIVKMDTLKSDLFTKNSCPALGIGKVSNGSSFIIYVSADVYESGNALNINSTTGSRLTKDGDDIKKIQESGSCCVYKTADNNKSLYFFTSGYIGESGTKYYRCLGENCEGTMQALSDAQVSGNDWKNYTNNITSCSKMPSAIWVTESNNGQRIYSVGTVDWKTLTNIYGGISTQYTLSASSTCPATLIGSISSDGESGLGDGSIDWGNSEDVQCDGILGQELLDFINKIFRWIQIIAPIFVIIMGSLEFAGAVLQDDKDAMKKASSKFIKRLIIAVALFFIPLILNFLLDIFNEFSKHDATICGIGKILIK